MKQLWEMAIPTAMLLLVFSGHAAAESVRLYPSQAEQGRVIDGEGKTRFYITNGTDAPCYLMGPSDGVFWRLNVMAILGKPGGLNEAWNTNGERLFTLDSALFRNHRVMCFSFADGLAPVFLDGRTLVFLNRKGEITSTVQDIQQLGRYGDGLYSVKNGKNLWGFLDGSGKMAVEFRFQDAAAFHEGLAAVKEKGKWGYIRKDGSWAIAPVYSQAKNFNQNRAVIYADGGYSFIDMTGKEAFPGKYKSAWDFSEGLAAVWTNGKYGYIDTNGSMVIQPSFYYTWRFGEGLAAVQWEKNEGFGYIDRTGKKVIEPAFHTAAPFDGDLAIVTIKDKTLNMHPMYIDRKGNLLEKGYDQFYTNFSH